MPHLTPTRRSPRTLANAVPVAAALAAVSLGLAACGGSSSTTTTTTNAAATAAHAATTPGATSTPPPGTATTPVQPNPARFSAVRECLAKKGIALPSRTAGGRDGVLGGPGSPQLPKGVSRTQFQEALRACGGGFAGGRSSRGRTALASVRFREALARFATCLRQNGIDVGAPNTSGKGPVFDTKGVNTGSPQFKAASAKCRTVLFSSLRGPRAAPGSKG